MTVYGTGRVFDRLRNAVAFILVILTLLVLLSTAAFAQVPAVTELDSVSQRHGVTPLPAATGCVATIDTAVTVFRPNLDSITRGQLDAHERVHRAQIAERMANDSTLDCFEAFFSMMENPMENLLVEVPAYRAQARWLADNTSGFDAGRFFEYWAKELYFAYRKQLAYEYILGFLQSGIAPSVQPLPEPLTETGV